MAADQAPREQLARAVSIIMLRHVPTKQSSCSHWDEMKHTWLVKKQPQCSFWQLQSAQALLAGPRSG